MVIIIDLLCFVERRSFSLERIMNLIRSDDLKKKI